MTNSDWQINHPFVNDIEDVRKQIDELKALCEGHDFGNVTGTAHTIHLESADTERMTIVRPSSANHLYISAIQRIKTDEIDPAVLAGKTVVGDRKLPTNIVTADDLKGFKRGL